MKIKPACLTFLFIVCTTPAAIGQDASASGSIHHDIYITLKDASLAAVEQQLTIGKKYLDGHPGELSFTASVLAQGLTRHQQVSYLHNETNFQVAFHLIFKDAKSHDEYQTSERHVMHFIPMSKSNWKELRVFDSIE